MSVLFASDVHVSARRPERAQAFVRFLSGPCLSARRLVLLGDVFDEWLGDDDDRPPHPEVLDALEALTGSGVPVDYCFGNHDFLTGSEFFRRTGCTPLPDASVIDVFDTPVVVLHGDVLCTRDEDYQRWRATFTNPLMQQQFLALPFAARIERAAGLRHESMRATHLKADDIMDVTPSAVLAMMQDKDVQHMVHGHTHRPGIEAFELSGEPAQRIVLGDWYGEEQILCWDERGPRLGSLRDLF